jgi:hypothetical protein
MTAAPTTAVPTLAEQLEKLSRAIEKSIRYHQRRRAWLETWHRWMMFTVIVSGSAAFSGVLPTCVRSEYLAFFAALIGAFDLATGIPVAARNHAILQGKFSSLLADMARNRAPTIDDLGEWTASRLEIEAEEPPIYWVIEAHCYNEICHARGDRKRAVHIPLWRSLTGNISRHNNFGIEGNKANHGGEHGS